MCTSAAFSCGILLLSIASLTDALPPTQTLQQEHPSFGRCTVDDTGKSTNTRNTSFLQDDASSTSDEECMLLLSEQDGLFANALNNMANQEESTGIRLNSVSTSEDIVSAATEMLRQRCMECTACTLRNFKKHLELFGNAAKESTVVVLGLGLHVHAFSKMAKNVVVVETDYSFCRSFLRSKAGSCVMQANVHIYCTRPNSSLEDETGSKGVQQHFFAARELIRDLIKQQFGDVPASTLAVLGSFPVAKLLLMQDFLDQSSVILARSRMCAEGLDAVNKSMRALASFDLRHCLPSDYTENIIFLQRLFSPPMREQPWTNYLTEEWELKDNNSPISLVNSVRAATQWVTSDGGFDRWKRSALQKFLDVHVLASMTGSDGDWGNIKLALEKVLERTAKEQKADVVLEEIKNSALQLARKAALRSGFKEYLELLLDGLAERHGASEPFVHALICELITGTERYIASRILDKMKDAIEEACELSENTPKLLLPALRLIREGMGSEESMSHCLRILLKLKEIDPGADLSELLQEAEQ